MDRDPAYVADIVGACREIAKFIGEGSREEFLSNHMMMSAVVRQLEIVGEATKRLSRAFRDAHPQIPRRRMAGLRDVLIHLYDEVDLDLVWEIAATEISAVREPLARLLPPEKE